MAASTSLQNRTNHQRFQIHSKLQQMHLPERNVIPWFPAARDVLNTSHLAAAVRNGWIAVAGPWKPWLPQRPCDRSWMLWHSASTTCSHEIRKLSWRWELWMKIISRMTQASQWRRRWRRCCPNTFWVFDRNRPLTLCQCTRCASTCAGIQRRASSILPRWSSALRFTELQLRRRLESWRCTLRWSAETFPEMLLPSKNAAFDFASGLKR